MNKFQEIKAKYPYMFAGENIGLSMTYGWVEMFSALCDEIDKTLGDNKDGFHWVQLKEKFGSARLYYGFGKTRQPMRIDIMSPVGTLSFKADEKSRDPKSEKQEIQKRIGQMIHKAEALTNNMCIVCGESPAKVDATGGYMLVLCEKHAKQRGSITGKDIWLEDDTDSVS